MNLPPERAMSNSRHTSQLVELQNLLQLVTDSDRIGRFLQTQAAQMPESYRKLLAHNDHMTLAVEAFHGCPVDVEVLYSKKDGTTYIREILLRTTRDRAVVQYGIVRLQLSALSQRTQDAILSEQIPLGRVLIEHNVLREVELVELWKVEMGSKLAQFFGRAEGESVYGRTAMIHLDDQPALELVEIVVV